MSQNSHSNVKYRVGNIVNHVITTMHGVRWTLDLEGGALYKLYKWPTHCAVYLKIKIKSKRRLHQPPGADVSDGTGIASVRKLQTGFCYYKKEAQLPPVKCYRQVPSM